MKYPIYSVTVRWSQDDIRGEYKDKPNWTKGLPEGRHWNSVHFYKMFRQDPGYWWAHHLGLISFQHQLKKDSMQGVNPSYPDVVVEFSGYETWCLTWFQHETFDTGQTDDEVLESFNRFIDRKQRQNLRQGQELNSLLMGAEDRWRWKGTSDGSPDNETEPPCRCKHCKRQGLIRIGH